VRLQRLLEIGEKLRHPIAGVEPHTDLHSIARSFPDSAAYLAIEE